MGDSASVPVSEHLGRAVSAAHADALGEDLLQLRRRAARYQRPYQRQRVVVEVRLHTTQTPTERRAMETRHLSLRDTDVICRDTAVTCRGTRRVETSGMRRSRQDETGTSPLKRSRYTRHCQRTSVIKTQRQPQEQQSNE